MRALEHEPWHNEYFAYKDLKKVLKWVLGEHARSRARAHPDDADDDDRERAALRMHTEGAFVDALLRELAKVSAFHTRESAALQLRLERGAAAADDALCRRARGAAAPPHGDVLFNAEVLLALSAGGAHATELSSRQLRRTEALASLEAVRDELDLLHTYCALNCRAVSKILKKHDKHTMALRFERLAAPLGERALGEPFASVLVAQLRARAQCLADEVGAALHGRLVCARSYTCGACAQPLREPVLLSCGHAFCLRCLAPNARAPGCCPSCAANVNPRAPVGPADVDAWLAEFCERHFRFGPGADGAGAEPAEPPCGGDARRAWSAHAGAARVAASRAFGETCARGVVIVDVHPPAVHRWQRWPLDAPACHGAREPGATSVGWVDASSGMLAACASVHSAAHGGAPPAHGLQPCAPCAPAAAAGAQPGACGGLQPGSPMQSGTPMQSSPGACGGVQPGSPMQSGTPVRPTAAIVCTQPPGPSELCTSPPATLQAGPRKRACVYARAQRAVRGRAPCASPASRARAARRSHRDRSRRL